MFAEIGLPHFWMGAYLGRAASGDHLTVGHDRQSIGECEHRIHVMLDEQDGTAFLQAGNQPDHAFSLGLSHAGQRFVEQDHPRIGR